MCDPTGQLDQLLRVRNTDFDKRLRSKKRNWSTNQGASGTAVLPGLAPPAGQALSVLLSNLASWRGKAGSPFYPAKGWVNSSLRTCSLTGPILGGKYELRPRFSASGLLPSGRRAP